MGLFYVVYGLLQATGQMFTENRRKCRYFLNKDVTKFIYAFKCQTFSPHSIFDEYFKCLFVECKFMEKSLFYN